MNIFVSIEKLLYLCSAYSNHLLIIPAMDRILITSFLCMITVLLYSQTTPVTVSGTQIQTEKVFDNTTVATVISHGTLLGVNPGHNVNVIASANYAKASADSNINITVTFTLTGADATLYELDTIGIITGGIINKRQLYRDSVILDSIKIYDGNTNCGISFSGVARNYVTHHILTTIDSVYFEDPNVGTNKPVHVIYDMDGEDYDNYLPPHDTILYASIIPRIPTIIGTKVQKSKIYDGTPKAEVTDTGTIRGIVDGDTLLFRISSSNYDDKNVGAGKSINVYYELYGKDTANYDAPYAYFLDCDIKPIQLSASGGTVECSKDFDSTTHAVVVLPSQPIGVLSGEQVFLTTHAEFEDANVGIGKQVYCWYQIYGRDMANYVAPIDSVVCEDGEIREVKTAVENVMVDMKIYPNPVSNYVYVESDRVVIYSMTGMKVYDGTGGLICVEGLDNGIYLVNGEKLIICR